MRTRDGWRLTTLGLLALMLMAATHVGVDTNSVQTISNKTFDDTNQHQFLKYNGKLRISGITAQSASFSVNTAREHIVTTGASTITATLPAATGSGDTYDICKWDTGAGTVVITRAGSDNIYSAGAVSGTTRTLVTRGDCDTIQDTQSATWLARGNGE
jgi:hypothetical protein